jgi:nucleoside-diphosphate-sugar epimerase
MKKVCIIGANGFLGSNLSNFLHSLDYQLLLISKNTNNISNILPSHVFINSYLDSIQEYEESLVKFSPDIMINFSWWGGNSHKYVNDKRQFDINIYKNINLLKTIQQFIPKCRYVGAGSFAEYGSQTNPINEDTKAKPDNYYGESKLFIKNYSENFCNQYNIDWTWIRPCFIYGPNDVSSRLIPTLTHKFINNETVYLDSCTKTIDYLYIEDFCIFMHKLLENNKNGVYNVLSGQPFQLKDLILIMKKIINSKSKIFFQNTNINKEYMGGNNTKITNATGHTNLKTFEQGIELYLKYNYTKLKNRE